jgi:hypothetical protein
LKGLEDPRTGNAGLPELLVIALPHRYLARLPALFWNAIALGALRLPPPHFIAIEQM